MAGKQPEDKPTSASDTAADAVLAASRALVALTVHSIASVEDTVDVVGARALVVVSALGGASLREVAEALGMHVSTASRLCDRLVSEGLLDRRDDPADRRQLALRLTNPGSRVVNRMFVRRRDAVGRILARMPDRQCRQLADALRGFAEAAGDVSERDLFAIGWTP